jgi:hypothetical protein
MDPVVLAGTSIAAAGTLLMALPTLAHRVLKAESNHLQRSAARRVKRQARESERAALADEAMLAERKEMERIREEAEQLALYVHHAPFVDDDGQRWGRTKRTPPPWM